MRELKVGDPVLLTLNSAGKVGITDGMLKYKDRRFRISRVVRLGTGMGYMRDEYFELEGCVSDKGVPYGITPDWLMPIRDIDTGCTHGRRK